MMDVNLLQSFVAVPLLTPAAPLARVQHQEAKQLIFTGHTSSMQSSNPLVMLNILHRNHSGCSRLVPDELTKQNQWC